MGVEAQEKGKEREIMRRLKEQAMESCPGSSLLPAKRGSVVPVALLVKQWVFCYFPPLKDFKSHFLQSYGGDGGKKKMNKTKKTLGKGDTVSVFSIRMALQYLLLIRRLPRWCMFKTLCS